MSKKRKQASVRAVRITTEPEEAQLSVAITFKHGKEHVERNYWYTGVESNTRNIYDGIWKAIRKFEEGTIS